MDDNGKGIVAALEREGRAKSPTKSAARLENDGEDEYVAFGNGRVGTRPQLSIIFRRADGSAKALAYAHLYSVESDDPDKGLTAEFTQTKVKVAGRNLEPLFRYLSQHRAAEVVEVPRSRIFELAETEPVVEKIEFLSLGVGRS